MHYIQPILSHPGNLNMCNLQVLTHSFSVHFVYPLLCHHSSLSYALFLITVIFNVNIRELDFRFVQCWHTGKVSFSWQAVWIAPRQDLFLKFHIAYCWLSNIFWQQDANKTEHIKKEEKHPNIFFPLFHLLPKPSLEWLKGGVFFLSLFFFA